MKIEDEIVDGKKFLSCYVGGESDSGECNCNSCISPGMDEAEEQPLRDNPTAHCWHCRNEDCPHKEEN